MGVISKPRASKPMDPRTAYQARMRRAETRAEEIAAEMIRDLALATNRDVRSSGLCELEQLTRREPSPNQSTDEEHGDSLCAVQDAAWLLGVALGRRLGGAR